MPPCYSLTGQIRKSSALPEFTGTLFYFTDAKKMRLSSLTSEERQDAQEAYAWIEALNQWVYYVVKEGPTPILARVYFQENQLVQQEHISKNRWTPPLAFENETIAAQLRLFKNHHILKPEEWKKEFEIHDLFSCESLTNFDLGLEKESNQQLKGMLFPQLEVGLTALKAEAKNKEEYCFALNAALTGKIDEGADCSIETKNNIADIRYMLRPKNIIAIVKSFLARKEIEVEISYDKVFRYILQVLSEELKNHGVLARPILETSVQLRHLKIKKIDKINCDLVTTLSALYFNITDPKYISFMLLHNAMLAFQKNPNFTEEMRDFYAIVKTQKESELSEREELSNQELEDLTQEIEQNIQVLIPQLELLHEKEMGYIAESPSRYSMDELRWFISCAEMKKEDSFSAPLFPTEKARQQYTIYIGNKATASLGQINIHPEELEFMGQNFVDRFSENLLASIDFFKTITPQEKEILDRNPALVKMIAKYFNGGTLSKFKSLWFVISDQLDLLVKNKNSENFLMCEALCKIPAKKLSEFFKNSDLSCYLAIKNLLPEITRYLKISREKLQFPEPELSIKENLFLRISNVAALYEAYSNMQAPKLTFVQRDMALQCFRRDPDYSQEFQDFINLMAIHAQWPLFCEEDFSQFVTQVEKKIAKELPFLEANSVLLMKGMAQNADRYSKSTLALLIRRLNELKIKEISEKREDPRMQNFLANLMSAYKRIFLNELTQLIVVNIQKNKDELMELINPLFDKLYNIQKNEINQLIEFLKTLPRDFQECLKGSINLRFGVARAFLEKSLTQERVVNEFYEILYKYFKEDKEYHLNEIQYPLDDKQQDHLINVYLEFCLSESTSDIESLAKIIEAFSISHWRSHLGRNKNKINQIFGKFHIFQAAFKFVNNPIKIDFFKSLYLSNFIAYCIDRKSFGKNEKFQIAYHAELRAIMNCFKQKKSQLWMDVTSMVIRKENANPDASLILDAYKNTTYDDWLDHLKLLQDAITYLRENTDSIPHQETLSALQNIYYEIYKKTLDAGDNEIDRTFLKKEDFDENYKPDGKINLNQSRDLMFFLNKNMSIEKIITSLPDGFNSNPGNVVLIGEIKLALFNKLENDNYVFTIKSYADLVKVLFYFPNVKETLNKYKKFIMDILDNYIASDLIDSMINGLIDPEIIVKIYFLFYIDTDNEIKHTQFLESKNDKIISNLCKTVENPRHFFRLMPFVSQDELASLRDKIRSCILDYFSYRHKNSKNEIDQYNIDMISLFFNNSKDKHYTEILKILEQEILFLVNPVVSEKTHLRSGFYNFMSLYNKIQDPIAKQVLLNWINTIFSGFYKILCQVMEKHPLATDELEKINDLEKKVTRILSSENDEIQQNVWRIISLYARKNWVKEVYGYVAVVKLKKFKNYEQARQHYGVYSIWEKEEQAAAQIKNASLTQIQSAVSNIKL